METFDAIVVGLGAAGAAAAYQLARRKARVLGIDQYAPPHPLGSSHGESRITRLAIGEGDAYVPLAMRSHELWREIEAATGASLLTVTGGLWISSAQRKAETHVKDFFANTLAAARRFGIAHEVLDAAQIRARFPQFRVAGHEQGYHEPGAGYLRPEACIEAQLKLARALGARLRPGERVEEIEQRGSVVRVRTPDGEYEAPRAVICAGAWVTRLVPSLAHLFTITRQAMFWFDVAASHEELAPPRFPVWIWELHDRERVIYGFPAIDGPAGGAKIATEQYRETTPPAALETFDRRVTEEDARAMHRELVAPYLPGMGPKAVKAAACVYTATPDFHFLIDTHPEMENVTVASPCSGHGFKHSAAVGEALAAIATGHAPALDLSSFGLARFSRAGLPVPG